MIRINKWRLSAVAWWILLALPACASTNVTSLRAPDMLADPYSRIMVYFPLGDLRLRQLVEDEFVEEDDRGYFVPSYSVLFPGREYTELDIQDILIMNSVDALLMLSLSDSGDNSNYNAALNMVVNQPWAFFNAELLEAESYSSVWVSTAESKGYHATDMDDLLRSMARRTVTQLYSDGLIH